jgi:hypothetical protein
VVLKRNLVVLGLAALACVRPPAIAELPRGPTRLPILASEYGGSTEHPTAIQPGARMDTLALPLADGGTFELADALVAGPVVLIWIGGAEHEALTRWIVALDRSLAQLELSAAPLEFAVMIVAEQTLVYRKLGARRPQLDELLAVLDGAAEQLRCCPDACEGAPCQ